MSKRLLARIVILLCPLLLWAAIGHSLHLNREYRTTVGILRKVEKVRTDVKKPGYKCQVVYNYRVNNTLFTGYRVNADDLWDDPDSTPCYTFDPQERPDLNEARPGDHVTVHYDPADPTFALLTVKSPGPITRGFQILIQFYLVALLIFFPMTFVQWQKPHSPELMARHLF
ncbi:DUF3592 domain-containing protein [Deinococcus fonticola]|uniref:DUF3592 domain-containing protein n=1 Tax=Deinococcus fonticola TaxID=2528713 RepID=UPI0010756268|nr:DUF3592 domain-containing protein [Deinococcus fonticola]